MSAEELPAGEWRDKAVATIRRYRFRATTEALLQQGIEQALMRAKIPYYRELALTAQDRPDFTLMDGTVLEIKIGGSLAEVTRQLHRYAQHESVTALVLVTTRARHGDLPDSFEGKPLLYVHLIQNSL